MGGGYRNEVSRKIICELCIYKVHSAFYLMRSLSSRGIKKKGGRKNRSVNDCLNILLMLAVITMLAFLPKKKLLFYQTPLNCSERMRQ